MRTILTQDGVVVTELGDLTPPALFRTPVARDRWSADDDEYDQSHRHLGEMTFDLNWVPDDPTHLALFDAWANATVSNWVLTLADGAVWSFTGYVVDFAAKAPVDNRLSVRVMVRPNSGITFAIPDDAPFLLLEDGGRILLEDGGFIRLEA